MNFEIIRMQCESDDRKMNVGLLGGGRVSIEIPIKILPVEVSLQVPLNRMPGAS